MKYLKSLLPFRWMIVVLFIVLMSIIITMGFASEDPLNPVYFKNKFLWYGGNIVLWFLLDKYFGLGRKGDIKL